jgi:1-hydroxycarotenoid 3,4-desaturase
MTEGNLAREGRVVVVGAGIGGLVAALLMAARGYETVVLESAAAPGGKMREILVGGRCIDAGPTVLAMRWVFDEIFDAVGASFESRVRTSRLERLARNAWGDGSRLDLYSDIDRNAEAIGDFAGSAEAQGYRNFSRRAEEIYGTLQNSFICASRPNLLSLMGRVGLTNFRQLMAISPYATLWGALQQHFRDPRLRQLFGRYSTYCGSSPFLTPATLMLVAHVERQGVWIIEGGMQRLAEALRDLAAELGVDFRFGCRAQRIIVEQGRAAGVETVNGELMPADAVIWNGDVGAFGAGFLGDEVRHAAPRVAPSKSSLSAVTWAMKATTVGFPLVRHNVFYGDDYRGEFDSIFKRGRLASKPTVYVCAQDRGERAEAFGSPERLLVLVNAPAHRAENPLSPSELHSCEAATLSLLRRCGLDLTIDQSSAQMNAPADFGRMFPASRGALYGPASHGWRSSFARAGALTKVPALYLAGGSVHPGPGVPMAALSGWQAALRATADLASIKTFRPAATLGGMSTLSAKTSNLGCRSSPL